MLRETLMDAHVHKRPICVSFIDLANAYGSVRQLVQKHLRFFRSEMVRRIIFNYYDLLATCIHTADWHSKWFQYAVGIYQGCPLSPILFDAVFELFLRHIVQHAGKGYKWLHHPIVLFAAYADDLHITTTTKEENQEALDSCQEWLVWSRTMKAKPKKCKSLARKAFATTAQRRSEDYQSATTWDAYSAYDPKLQIAGQQMTTWIAPGAAQAPPRRPDPCRQPHRQSASPLEHSEAE